MQWREHGGGDGVGSVGKGSLKRRGGYVLDENTCSLSRLPFFSRGRVGSLRE